MKSSVSVDGKLFDVEALSITFNNDDCSIMLRHADLSLELFCVREGGRLHIDNRSLDEVLGMLLGAPLTCYPNGQLVCAAFADLTTDGDVTTVCAEFPFDWDRYLDLPDATYPELRSCRIDLRIS